MTVDVKRVAADLAAEQEVLDAVVSALDDDQWRLDTPSAGWTIADQIGHLTYFDGVAAQAIEDPQGFAASRDELMAASLDGGADAAEDFMLGRYRAMAPPELLAAWRDNRSRLARAAAGLSDGDRIEWYGPSMGAKSFLTARLMETWAHGQDVLDAARSAGVHARREPTDRLRHIAQLGVITRAWSYLNRGLDVPEDEVRVELEAPSGDTWTWGPDNATDVVRGPAEDFCLVVTQRRHPHDTRLAVQGDLARDWLAHAQAFAGPPTEGPVATSLPE
ncbi:MAG: TIGR03084 family metal-binding protein [Acidimicrobiales bacterium]|nr:TIGR03084 family metal-binding protein [Acidimicrobiales bacterium]